MSDQDQHSISNGAVWSQQMGTLATGVLSSKEVAKPSREADEPEHGTQKR